MICLSFFEGIVLCAPYIILCIFFQLEKNLQAIKTFYLATIPVTFLVILLPSAHFLVNAP